MTAIVTTTAEWGVLVAADGRLSRTDSATPESDCTQKIFPIKSTDQRIVWALAGSIAAPDKKFDLRNEFSEYTEKTRIADYSSPDAYAEAIAVQVQGALAVADYRPKGEPASIGHGWKIVEAIFAGCFADMPFFLMVEFWHDLKSVFARLSKYEEGPGHAMPYGSEAVWREMYDARAFPLPNSKLSKYTANIAGCPLVSDARKFAVGYIEACYSPEGRALDPNECRTIGGHIHVATIKPRSGFQWLVPPLKDGQSA